MRGVIGTHLGLPRGELIRGWAVRPDSDAWLAAQYEAHNAQVRARVPRGKLLEFNVTEEGWAPTPTRRCAPSWHPGQAGPLAGLPHDNNVNEGAQLEKARMAMVVLSYACRLATGGGRRHRLPPAGRKADCTCWIVYSCTSIECKAADAADAVNEVHLYLGV